jgi:hypothetical protein
MQRDIPIRNNSAFKILSNEKCRNCGFIIDSHEMIWRDGSSFPMAKATQFESELNINLFCKEFIPNDNLQYLEWKYGQLAIKSSDKSLKDMPLK